MLLSLPWPGLATATNGPEPGGAEGHVSDRPGASRLERRDGGFVDAWTGHTIECIPLSDDVLERARVFARATHDALQPVLRSIVKGARWWLASCVPIRAPADPLGARSARGRARGAAGRWSPAGRVDSVPVASAPTERSWSVSRGLVSDRRRSGRPARGAGLRARRRRAARSRPRATRTPSAPVRGARSESHSRW